ncbi:helix-turn-helix transcriptional regulator [Sphingobacterium thalpophilum]|uniref:helix-turn-helix transcriptional regulator n=1 Tax=Sphingobacterium thalpophilum TaxID=259 RepID=UPI0024A78527|nr:helix-turn-helix transcriptional regulator [Sphingobacterium thalpophilum]
MLVDESIDLKYPHHLAPRHTAPKGLYFNFIASEDAILCTKNQYIASKKIGTHTFLEVAGTFDEDWNFNIHNSQTTLWLAFQFHGSSLLAAIDRSALLHQQYLAYVNTDKELIYQIKAGKVSMILIGLNIEDPARFAQEWDTLQIDRRQATQVFAVEKLGYRIRKALEHIQQTKYSSYSLITKLQFYTSNLIELYHRDLIEQRKSMQQEDISLLHRAKAYIYANYTDREINIQRIADELLTSERTLYRVFKDNGLTVNSAIRTIRIHKGREMLRTSNKSVDMIAFTLQFSTAKYFIKTYVRYFGHTPAMERKLHPPPPEPNYNFNQESKDRQSS